MKTTLSKEQELKVIKSLWEWIDEITYHKTPINLIDKSSWKYFDSFMINRFISMDLNYLDIVNTLQTIPYDQKEQFYIIYKNLLPKQKRFFKYLKSKKKDYNKELITLLNMYFNCSTRETLLSLDILSKEEITNIIQLYGKSDKEIKALLK